MNNVFIRPSQGEELDAIHTFPSSHAPRIKSGGGYWHAPIFGLTHRANGLLALLLCCLVFSGCGGSYVVKGASTASTGTLSPSPNSVDFGTVSVGQSANTKIDVVNQGTESVEISELTLSGSSFRWTGKALSLYSPRWQHDELQSALQAELGQHLDGRDRHNQQLHNQPDGLG